MTFYRKYRPQTISELDLTLIREQLFQVLSSKKVPHAFLFTGPRGLGKTSAARILAKAINCLANSIWQRANGKEKRKKSGEAIGHTPSAISQIEPCNKCPACLSITQGSALDFIEIDGASNRGIDNIRELRERIKLSPVSLNKKIYVIDEVHMLTTEAFNALLKTLEEPPEHVVFILATTEPEKLPQTIVSRCFVLSFNQPTNQELKRSLERVIKGEKLEVDSEAVDGIVARADGSFRDAHKILEQLAFAGKKINKQLFENVYQASQEDELLKLLQEGQLSQALNWLGKAKVRGADWKTLIQNLLIKLRDELLVLCGVGESNQYRFSQRELKQLIELFLKAGASLKSAPLPFLPLEIAVIEFCQGMAKASSQGGQEEKTKVREEPKEEREVETNPRRTPAEPDNNGGPEAKPLIPLDEVLATWERLLQTVKPQNHSVEALLRSARPTGVKGKAVVIEVFYEFHKGRLETSKCRAIVEAALQEVLQQPKLMIEYVLGEKRKSAALIKSSKDDSDLVQAAEEVFKE